MRTLLFTVALLAGCEPPPAVGGAGSEELAIRILYPEKVDTAALDAEGNLEVLVVVDIEGLDFTKPGAAIEAVEGQGHWHLTLGTAYVPPQEMFATIATDEYQPGDFATLTASLHGNDHDALGVEDIWEFEVTAFEEGDTGGG